MSKCPDCFGTGEIVLLVSRSSCKRCGGTGQIGHANRLKMSEYLKTPQGRAKLTASLLKPSTGTVHHVASVGRKTFQTED